MGAVSSRAEGVGRRVLEMAFWVVAVVWEGRPVTQAVDLPTAAASAVSWDLPLLQGVLVQPVRC